MKYICIQQDDNGQILVKTDGDPVNMDGAQPVKDAEEACSIVEQALGQPDDDDAMGAAQKGYTKEAGKRMMGGGSESPMSAVFGE